MRNDNLLLIFQFYRTQGNDTKNLKISMKIHTENCYPQMHVLFTKKSI